MKILIVLFVIFCHADNVTPKALFDIVAEKVKQFANSFITFIKNVKHKVNSFVFRRFSSEESKPRTIYQFINKQKTKKDYKDLVHGFFQENSSEIPGLASFKIEPTALLSTPQLANYHGKKVESHVVITGDGYVLTIHRVMKPLDRPHADKVTNPTVLLHHGLFGSSADWILLGKEKSLPYILSNLGYDVWMINARGNCYSRGHVSYDIHSSRFWKFSWQEMGKYDLPAVVEYIRKFKNSNESINFIGHSMGTSAFLVLLSTAPHYNKYFRMGILLAPLVYMSNIEGPLRVFSPLVTSLPQNFLKKIGDTEFFPSKKISPWIQKKYCKSACLYCSNPLLFLSGSYPSHKTWSTSLIARVLHHVPAGGSTNTILHYAQIVRNGKFQMFEDNSEFPLNKVTLPIALFTSSDDWLATIPDVLKLYFSIPNPIDHHIIRGKNFTHTEFAFGPQADILVYNKIVDVLANGLSQKETHLNEI